MSCGSRSSQPPPDVLVKTEVVQETVPSVYLNQYQEPSEPKNMTVGGLVEYILEQRALLQKHNADKATLKSQQNKDDTGNTENADKVPQK